MPTQPGALAGVRVLDLADETAVFGTKLLSDLGADVLRIEPPDGDPIRRLGPFASPKSLASPKSKVQSPKSRDQHPTLDLGLGTWDSSLSHWWDNSGKRAAILDLTTADGRDRLLKLAAGADIVVETGGTGVDWAAFQADQPALTVVSVSGYGLTGPRKDWQVPELIAWAISGAMGITGVADRYPLHSNWSLANHVAGLHVAIGALSGLYQRRQTGRGVRFDLSRVEAVASMHATLTTLYSYNNGHRQARQGVENVVAAPYGAFPTSDGQVIMIALTMAQWQALLEWMRETGRLEEWLLDDQYATMGRRSPHQKKIHEALGRWTRQLSTDDLVAEANRRRIPCAPINSPLDILQDAQLRARGYFVPVEVPALGRAVDFPGLPYQFSEGGGSVRPAPDGVQGTGDGVQWLPRTEVSSPPDTPYPVPSTLNPVPQTLSPLAGLHVLDLTWAMAGPQGTRALADLGATVVKVEAREAGDIVRGLPPHWQGQPDFNQSGFFHRLNRNKRNLTLDLKKPEAIALVKRLARWADVIVDNFGCGVMERLGLGPEILSEIKPELPRISLSGYGQEGPTRNYPSFALISQARGGIVYSTAYPDGLATGCSLNIGDTGASLQLAIVILAAVEQARRTGRGPQVDMSQLEAATVFIGPALLEASVNGRSFVPRGNLLPDRDAAPHGAYPTTGDDRWIAIAVLDEDQWSRLTQLMGQPDLANDPRFRTAADRVAHVEALDAQIGAWTRDQEAHSLAEQLQAAGVPAGAVQDAHELIHVDPQLGFRRFYQTIDQPEIGPIPMDTNPLRYSDGPVPIQTAGPLISEHNEWVLREVLGLGEEEIVDLIVNEVV